ncbi:hypothetical protein BS17DRAFT_384379 [Gyrodon lividus]|nr:hypothetical protein BS17DRAFT_384379 [Gyrodon lividus]
MDCCGKCLDYFCVGPRADRERFRPWKKKPRAVVEADERAREEKKREEARGHATNNRTRTQKPVRPSRQHAARQNHTSVVSPVPPLANGVASERPGNIHLGGADRVAILQLQEQMEQLRRHFDDTVSDKRKAEAERDALKKKVEELQYNGREPHKSQEHTSPVAEAGPSLSHAEPSGCTPTPSTFPAGPPTSSSSATEGHPSILAQSHLRSIEVEERTKEEKRRAKAEKKRARRKRRKD